MDSKMKRRDFLKISALASVAVVAAACTPTSTPTVRLLTTSTVIVSEIAVIPLTI